MGVISTEQLQALEQELKQYILKEPDMLTNPGETCFYQCPASAVQIRAAEIGKHECGSMMFHQKSISQLYKNGCLTGGSGMQRNVAEKYPGIFFITNERFFLLTSPRKLDLPLTDIFIINFYSDGFAIMARGRTYMVETLHANRIREFLQKNMLHISYYEEMAAGISGIHLPSIGDAFDFRKLKLSLDLLCRKKTPAVAVMELTPPPQPQAAPQEEEPSWLAQHKPHLSKKATDILLWLLALFLAFYFIFPLLLEVNLEGVRNFFSGNWGTEPYRITTGDMREIEESAPFSLEEDAETQTTIE